jgi:hypothetical protein
MTPMEAGLFYGASVYVAGLMAHWAMDARHSRWWELLPAAATFALIAFT